MKFIIGDIHGEITKLKSLIDFIISVDKNPTLVFIGDYLDKGESPFRVLKYLESLSKIYECIFLIGNHEFIWLNLRENLPSDESYLMKYGGQSTIESLGCKDVRSSREKLINEFSDFFHSLVNFWLGENFIVVHSGILPEDYNKQPEDLPQDKLLFNRYEFIKNQQLYLGKYKVIFGHTGFYYPYVDSFKIGIDTSACYIKDQPLTAFCLTDSHFYNSDNNNYTIDIENISSCPVITRVKPWRMK